jgi:hypothetical protein
MHAFDFILVLLSFVYAAAVRVPTLIVAMPGLREYRLDG